MLKLIAEFPLFADLVLDTVHISLVQNVALLKSSQDSFMSSDSGFQIHLLGFVTGVLNDKTRHGTVKQPLITQYLILQHIPRPRFR